MSNAGHTASVAAVHNVWRYPQNSSAFFAGGTFAFVPAFLVPVPTLHRALRDAGESNMWKIGDVEPVKVLGADGYPYGFNITTEVGKPIVSFAYTTRDAAHAAGVRE